MFSFFFPCYSHPPSLFYDNPTNTRYLVKENMMFTQSRVYTEKRKPHGGDDNVDPLVNICPP